MPGRLAAGACGTADHNQQNKLQAHVSNRGALSRMFALDQPVLGWRVRCPPPFRVPIPSCKRTTLFCGPLSWGLVERRHCQIPCTRSDELSLSDLPVVAGHCGFVIHCHVARAGIGRQLSSWPTIRSRAVIFDRATC
jgi:hypothetical protein